MADFVIPSAGSRSWWILAVEAILTLIRVHKSTRTSHPAYPWILMIYIDKHDTTS
jgi:hypothetical protein